MGKVRFSILEKTPDRILREDMKFKGMTSRGAATGPRQRPFHGSTAAAERGVSVPPASTTTAAAQGVGRSVHRAHRAMERRNFSCYAVASLMKFACYMWEGYRRHTGPELHTGGKRGSKPAGFGSTGE